MKRASKFLALSLSEKAILFKAWILLGAIRLGFELLPFSVVKSLVTRERPVSPPRSHASIDELTWAVTVASGFVPGATCLVQAMALQFLLQRAGYPALMHIGVNKDEIGKLKAHAWVESQGRVLIGGSDFRAYTRLLALE